MTLPVNVESLIDGRVVESDRIEFKKGWNPDAIYRTICAFANDFEDISGGYVVVGVEEENGRAKRPVCGVDIDDLDDIQKSMIGFNNLIMPYYQPRTAIEDVDGKKVFVIWVTAGDRRPYKVPDNVTAKHKEYNYYIRYNSSSIVAKGDYEVELLNMANRVPFDDRGNTSASIKDVSMLLVRDFLTQTGSKLVEQLETSSPLQILRQMDLVEGPNENVRIKNIALMLFSYHPEKFFPSTQVDIVIYPKGKDADPDNFIEIDPIKGPVHQIIRRTLDYVKTMVIRQKVAKVATKAEADRTFNYPYQALEEVIVNALYHRSYQEREPVEISIMPEQIEIISYSGADRSIRLEDLRAGKRIHARRYRNRRLGDFLKELDLTEGRGTGIPTVKKELEKNGSEDASYESDEGRTYFYVSIPCHKDFVCKELVVDDDGHIRERKLTVTTAVDVRKQIFDLIVTNTHISRRELSDAVGINQSAIQKHIETLVKNGNIEKRGIKRGRYYVILKQLDS